MSDDISKDERCQALSDITGIFSVAKIYENQSVKNAKSYLCVYGTHSVV